MQTAPENGKGRRATNTTAQVQTDADATARRQRQQAPTLTPRYRRVLLALLKGSRTREDIDRIAGPSRNASVGRIEAEEFALQSALIDTWSALEVDSPERLELAPSRLRLVRLPVGTDGLDGRAGTGSLSSRASGA